MVAKLENSSASHSRGHGMDFEGHGVLIVARETVNDAVPLCMALGNSGNAIKLIPCFREGVVPNLLEGWETGAVVKLETLQHNRWEMAPCTSDGKLERDDATGGLIATPGDYSVTGPRCMLKQMDGVRAGRCFDGDTNPDSPGGETLVFPCVHRWGQFLSIGDGLFAPRGSLFFHIPDHIIRKLSKTGQGLEAYMCLSVGEVDDEGMLILTEEKPLQPLSDWVDRQIVSIPCSHKERVIEWVFVPYILEDNSEVLTVDANTTCVEDGTECASTDYGEANAEV